MGVANVYCKVKTLTKLGPCLPYEPSCRQTDEAGAFLNEPRGGAQPSAAETARSSLGRKQAGLFSDDWQTAGLGFLPPSPPPGGWEVVLQKDPERGLGLSKRGSGHQGCKVGSKAARFVHKKLQMHSGGEDFVQTRSWQSVCRSMAFKRMNFCRGFCRKGFGWPMSAVDKRSHPCINFSFAWNS